MAPAVSVVVPCYNQASFLPSRFASIFGQIYAPAEVIVVDDASTDNTATRLAALHTRVPLRVHRNTERNGSACAQWETGIRLAQHPWVWIAEADDLSEPAFLATLLAAAARHPKAGFVYCQSALTGADGKAFGTFRDFADELDTHRWRVDHIANGTDEARRFLSLRNIIPNVGACLVRRDLWLAALPLDASLRLCGDWLAYARLLAHTDLAFVAAPLNRFRAHASSMRANTSAADQISEGYRVRAAVAALHGADDGERELAARFAATEWIRLMPEIATLAREAFPTGVLAAAEAFDRHVIARLRDPALREMPRIDLYHAEHGNFSESRRASQVVAPGAWRTLHFTAGSGALRLDPLNQPGRVELRRVVVRDTETNRVRWSAENHDEFASLTFGGDARVVSDANACVIESTGNDPQIFIPVGDTPGAACTVEIDVRITLPRSAEPRSDPGSAAPRLPNRSAP